MSFRFLIIVFYACALLIFAVHLRIAESRNFYQLCKINLHQDQLKQQLWEKQLQLENLINPSEVLKRTQEKIQ
jgi:hypothetical protein